MDIKLIRPHIVVPYLLVLVSPDNVRQRDNNVRQRDNSVRQRGISVRQRDNSVRQRGNSVRQRGNSVRQGGINVSVGVNCLSKRANGALISCLNFFLSYRSLASRHSDRQRPRLKAGGEFKGRPLKQMYKV